MDETIIPNKRMVVTVSKSIPKVLGIIIITVRNFHMKIIMTINSAAKIQRKNLDFLKLSFLIFSAFICAGVFSSGICFLAFNSCFSSEIFNFFISSNYKEFILNGGSSYIRTKMVIFFIIFVWILFQRFRHTGEWPFWFVFVNSLDN